MSLLPIRTYEDVMNTVGGFGLYQKICFVFIQMADLFGAFIVFSPLLVAAAPPNWSCSPSNFTNGTNSSQIFHEEISSIVTTWQLVCDKEWIPNVINTIQMTGFFLGAAIFGQLSDSAGRRHTYFFGNLLLVLPCLISAFVPNWYYYAVCRLLTGIGFGGLQVISSVYPLEIVSKQYRSLTGTFGFWAIGQMLLAPMGYFFRKWQTLLIVSCSTSIPFFFGWFFVPESPRWLLQKERYSEAHEILEKIAKKNGRSCPDLNIIKQITVRDDKRVSCMKLWMRKNFKKTAVIGLSWYTVNCTYYVISYNFPHDLINNKYLSLFLIGCVDWPAMLSVIAANRLTGRKNSLFFYTVQAAIGILIILVLNALEKPKNLKILLFIGGLIAKGCTVAAMYVLRIYTAETFPTVVRSSAVALGSMFGCTGSISAPLLLIIFQKFPIGPFLVIFVLFVLMLAFVCFCLNETRNLHLSDSFKEQQAAMKDLDEEKTFDLGELVTTGKKRAVFHLTSQTN
ncbi:DgyrCDS4135 [Dimorphilus gyrociliatus]|uniref:DgyrCDS4135 n=1 Tax=Dimorphilus gyrociliatus TaxID=2664684 RepID=A0A7I8VG17_9ANNE|nr:DgyrCDS4135 [Dimorphilus gyrociliatus]